MTSLTAVLPASAQRVQLHVDVLAHLARYRQLRWYAREAGGQLFGSLQGDEVEIRHATGPYRNDQRSRFGYRSNPRRAQQMINAMSKRGMLYLGEWHTHPEACPTASGEDLATFAKIVRRSTLSLSSLLLIIQGMAEGQDGLAIYSQGSEGLHRWQLVGAPGAFDDPLI